MASPLAAAVLLAGVAASTQAQVAQMLHTTPTSPTRDNYTGGLGAQFQVGPTNVIVSHLGVFDLNDDGLNVAHNAGLFNSSGSTLLGGVVVPAGTTAYLTNGFRWMPLDPPLLLNSNTTYLVASLVVTSDGDSWQDAYVPTWNPFYVGATATTTRHSMYGPGGTTAWPPASFSQNGNNNTYGNVSLAYIEIDQARVGVQSTNVSLSAGQTLFVVGFASGQAGINYQWYRTPATPVPGQTNAVLAIPNSTTNDTGVYYLTATNALGGQQSPNVTVSVTSFPVGITKDPTNLTVFANYPATMSVTATGSPPITYQWFRNSALIPGATTTSISIASASVTNNGDVFFCVASNYTSATPYTSVSASATLTVIPNVAQPQQILHGARANTATNNFGGLVGGRFLMGNSPVTVTHLGYYASQFTDAAKTNAVLTLDHHVGIFSADASVMLGSVVVHAGTNAVVNGYMWTQLDAPVTLSSNTTYLLLAEVFSGSPTPDPWGDTYAVPDWNTYFTGVNNASAGNATYWGAAWPNAGVSGGFSGQMYSAPNLAILAPTAASAFVAPLSVTQYVGLDVTLTATAVGQAPVTVQWYKAPNTLLPGRTNLTLTLSNPQLSDSGDYYVIATNPGGPAQSGNASVTIIPDVGPSITQDIQPQSAFLHQTVRFAVGAAGTPPLSYQWTFNSNPIPGATGSVLTLADVSPSSVGNYQALVTNNFGFASSASASLAVAVPAWGTYPSAVMGTNLLAYYRFSDVNSGLGVATNQGSLGVGYNGAYEGGYSGDYGPMGIANFETNNLAVSLDGFTADVLIPPLQARVTNATLAAWVYQNEYQSGYQVPNAGLYFHRASDVFGLTVNADPVTGGAGLRYTWNGTYYNFNPNLVLPTNQWAFVAVVVTPTNATVYLQDGVTMRSTNNAASHTPVTFAGNSYAGWDTAGGTTGRRWFGLIDEVMVFNTALSPVAVNALSQGVPASATLTLAPSGSNLVLSWPGGKLLEAAEITGPWTTNSAAASPYTLSPSAAKKFYRVKLQ